jgi:uncharacterized membrane protein
MIRGNAGRVIKTISRFAVNYTLLILLSLLTVGASWAFAQDFTINRFLSDMTIAGDSSVTVEETLDVQFHRSKHGIYREIPFRYVDDFGNTIRTPIDVQSVTDAAGKNWKYRVSRTGNLLYIRIGDPGTYVDGHQTYVITYTVGNAILFFHDHDELYWNVTGNDWKAEIREASASVALAVKDKSRNLWASCYTGVRGSRSSDCSYETSGNTGDFSTKKNLNVGEGLTVAFGWDKGLVSPPSAWEKFLWTIDIRENWVFILPLLSMIIMINLWRTRGRDAKVRESVTVMYEPPKYNDKPLTPGEVGTLIDEKLDPRDITSTLVGLAVKGYVKMEESRTEGLIFDSSDYYLVKVKEPDEDLSPFEKMLMNRIFAGDLPGRMVSDLKNNFYKELDVLKSTLYGELINMKYFSVSPEKVRKIYQVAGISVIVLSSFVLTFLVPAGKGVIAGFLTGLPVLALSRVMPAKTRAGTSAYMDILGFQEFMSRAEKDRLERMGDKDLFSRFLPYAIALDVVDNWAKAFEGIYQEPPQWYTSHAGGMTFNPHIFSRSISSATSSIGSAMYSAPRGSGISGGGSGGGGFSGGGFGGGGGGSW